MKDGLTWRRMYRVWIVQQVLKAAQLGKADIALQMQ